MRVAGDDLELLIYLPLKSWNHRCTPASQALRKILNQTVGYSADKLDPESLLSRPQLVTKGAQFSPHCSEPPTIFSAPKNTGRSFDLFTGV